MEICKVSICESEKEMPEGCTHALLNTSFEVYRWIKILDGGVSFYYSHVSSWFEQDAETASAYLDLPVNKYFVEAKQCQ